MKNDLQNTIEKLKVLENRMYDFIYTQSILYREMVESPLTFNKEVDLTLSFKMAREVKERMLDLVNEAQAKERKKREFIMDKEDEPSDPTKKLGWLLNLIKSQIQTLEREISFMEINLKNEKCFKNIKEEYDSDLHLDKLDLHILKLNCGRLDEILKKITEDEKSR